ncbi:class I SAM-dependent methyltransferase, partial [Flavobacterium psychrophilum]|uniref:class I SAM-dependent methyltransferase n=1 Tax=Flavobacterium psychrophilum TaxID=96345 RepID=UPI001056684B
MADIHPQSLASFRQLARLFGVSDRICQWVCADATAWRPEHGGCFDLILSETMKHLLQQEPQVQIFSHLQQFLSADGELLPQQINLAAALQWHSGVAAQTVMLGPLFSLNRQTAAQLAAGDRSL